MRIFINFSIIGTLFVILGCNPEPTINPYRLEYRIMELEYAILEKDGSRVRLTADQIKFMLEESMMNATARRNLIDILDKIIIYRNQDRNFDLISIFKLEYLKEVYDKEDYLPLLWQFGNDLVEATTVAMDPKLDLYDWNEFKEIVDCMDGSYQLLSRSSPDMDLLLYSPGKSELHPKYFNDLRTNMERFIKAIQSDDWMVHSLDESARALLESYKKYLLFFSRIEWSEEDVDLLR
ncbi:MAG TPA: hypothetical protein PKC30_05995 [Saprospiraceae bacterium]|nr:hypothetical protein [Saprospiraceae bacterium]